MADPNHSWPTGPDFFCDVKPTETDRRTGEHLLTLGIVAPERYDMSLGLTESAEQVRFIATNPGRVFKGSIIDV